MIEKDQSSSVADSGKALLRRELDSGLASGISKRSPDQIRAAIRKAREAA